MRFIMVNDTLLSVVYAHSNLEGDLTLLLGNVPQ